MTLLSDIRELDGRHLVMGMLGFLGVIGPSFLIIYHYHPDLIEKYDILKIITFSAALSAPILFLNVMIAAVTAPSNGDADQESALIMASLGSTTMLYVALLVAYILKLGILNLFGIVAVLLVPYTVFAYFSQRPDEKKIGNSPSLTHSSGKTAT